MKSLADELLKLHHRGRDKAGMVCFAGSLPVPQPVAYSALEKRR